MDEQDSNILSRFIRHEMGPFYRDIIPDSSVYRIEGSGSGVPHIALVLLSGKVATKGEHVTFRIEADGSATVLEKNFEEDFVYTQESVLRLSVNSAESLIHNLQGAVAALKKAVGEKDDDQA